MQKQDDPNSHGWWRVGKLAIGSSSLHFSVVQFDKMLFSVYVIRSASWRFAVWCISSYGNHAGSLPCPGGCKLFGYLCCTIAALSHSLPPPPTFFFQISTSYKSFFIFDSALHFVVPRWASFWRPTTSSHTGCLHLTILCGEQFRWLSPSCLQVCFVLVISWLKQEESSLVRNVNLTFLLIFQTMQLSTNLSEPNFLLTYSVKRLN